MHRPKSAAALQRECDRWNKANPVGTTVKYHPVIRGPKFAITTTKSTAYVLSGHTAVLFVEGISGCVAMDACEPIEAGKDAHAGQ